MSKEFGIVIISTNRYLGNVQHEGFNNEKGNEAAVRAAINFLEQKVLPIAIQRDKEQWPTQDSPSA